MGGHSGGGSNSLRRCAITGQSFTTYPAELEGYLALGLPEPELCAEERIRRLLSFRSGGRFFGRQCDLTARQIYSVYAADTEFPVVDPELMNSAEWCPEQYGSKFDPQRGFVSQLASLWRKAPRPAVSVRASSNCGVVHDCWNVRDSFCLTGSSDCSGCFYSTGLRQCRECVDCYFLQQCNSCYECLYCRASVGLRWSEYCYDCQDSTFLSGCVACRDCFFCVGLDNAQFCFRNQQLSEAEYRLELKRWKLSDRDDVDRARREYQKFVSSLPLPHRYIVGTNDGSLGNALFSCGSVYSTFECADASNLLCCMDLVGAQQCIEGFGGAGVSASGQFVSVGGTAVEVFNSVDCIGNVRFLNYCAHCADSENLFGCIGLSGREFCILNVQYTEQEYYQTLTLIERRMRSDEEWGRFLPVEFSEYCYNHSAAGDRMPLNETQAAMLGYRWGASVEDVRPSALLKVAEQRADLAGIDADINGSGVRSTFKEVPRLLGVPADDQKLTQGLFLCEITGVPFQFSQHELVLYRAFGVPLPDRVSRERYRERLARTSALRLLPGSCPITGRGFLSAFTASDCRPVVVDEVWREAVRQGFAK